MSDEQTSVPGETGTLTYRYVAVTDVGRRRTMNQDSGYAGPNLLVIADGMGGAAAGDLASAETMHVIRRLDEPPSGDIIEILAGAVHRANDRLAEVIEADSEVEGMGTTLTAMLWDGEKFGLAHIGDSRGYRLRDGVLTQITKDHTFVQSLIDEGRLTRDEARLHPHRSLILRVLLGSDDNDPDLNIVEPQLGDRYLLCSDGLSDMIDDDSIARTLGEETIDVAAVDLVRRALENGGSDNITCVIAEMVPVDAEVDENLAGASGEPMLVGAASDHARRGGVHAAVPAPLDTPADERRDTDETPVVIDQQDLDPEELRYAPREPSRYRWVRLLALIVVILAVLAIIGKLAYDWTQDQYFVADDKGSVVIYRGVQADVPLISLNHVYERTDVTVESLPNFARTRVQNGIESSSLGDARDSVSSLRDLVAKCADPKTASAPGSDCERTP